MIQFRTNGSAVKSKAVPMFDVPAVLEATENVVLTDLDRFQVKVGEKVNLYLSFPANRVKSSQSVHQAMLRGLLLKATQE